jgi:hypothetical protein
MNYFDMKDFGDVFTSFLFKEITQGAKEVRKAAIQSLVTYLRVNYYSNKSNEVVKKFTVEFACAENYQNRLAFLEFYEQAANNFSRKFFKRFDINEIALGLASDKVVEVKRKFMENVMGFKRMIEKDDSVLHAQLEAAVNLSMRDKNKYISQVS